MAILKSVERQSVSLKRGARELQYFLYSQAVADGFRTTFAILIPALIGLYTGYFQTGLTLSLGAMCISLTDAPGPVIHKRNGMLFCIAFAVGIALITPLARQNAYTLAAEIAFVTFFFSMFNVYGNRAGAVGNAAILVMILTMDRIVPWNEILQNALLIGAGGLFYTILSLILYNLQPYKIAQRALSDCIREIATYLSIRADFYDPATELDENYKKLVNQQIIVNEKQDAVRELFFKTRQIVQESTDEGRKLVFTFIETVDLFEDITASYYDYVSLRKQFAGTGGLELIHTSLKKIVTELNRIGIAIQTAATFEKGYDYDAEVRRLKEGIDNIRSIEPSAKLVLTRIIVNIRNLLSDLNNIEKYFDKTAKIRKTGVDHSHFVTHQSLGPAIFWNNLSFQSSVFRHALRVSLACLAGFLVSNWMSYGHHSYWILLTIAFILKPAFSLTKQRNIQRIVGTLAGGLIGVVILLLIANKTVHFLFMVIFMIGAYTFMRIKYLVMVICITPYVLILFSFLGSGFKDVAQERVIDTVIGCAIAFLASHILFPTWESDQLKTYMQGILKANAAYMQRVLDALSGRSVGTLEYKLARKDVYLNSANLSAAFQRMMSEPKSKQGFQTQLHQFVVLNHILFSNIATLVTSLLSKEIKAYPEEYIHLAKKVRYRLEKTSQRLGASDVAPEPVKPDMPSAAEMAPEDALMKEQLTFLDAVSTDIDKITKAIIS
jgi:uncharacterized membrane protein (TIGR01666 family)